MGFDCFTLSGQHTLTGTSSTKSRKLEELKNSRVEKKERQSRKVRLSSTSLVALLFASLLTGPSVFFFSGWIWNFTTQTSCR